MATVNKYLGKRKLPPLEVSKQHTDWHYVKTTMESCCAAIERVSDQDKKLLGIVGKLKQTFRKLCMNADTGKVFASLIPNDIFGSVLSGGLGVVFTALEQTGLHREAVSQALERLPRILEDHTQYTELASEDNEIHRRTATLYTEVCLTLDCILRWYMMHGLSKDSLEPNSL